jgi:hypothetical protein
MTDLDRAQIADTIAQRLQEHVDLLDVGLPDDLQVVFHIEVKEIEAA